MRNLILDALLAEYREVLGPDTAQANEIARFRDFLLRHGGLKKLETTGGRVQILDRVDSLRCFHFSQYLDWYLLEKEGLPHQTVEKARSALSRLNEWFFEKNLIPVADFEENRESILGAEGGPPIEEDAGDSGDEEEDRGWPEVQEEKDFYVPGEYSVLVRGEFVLTKVQEGILYGIRNGDREEIGPILVDREVSGGSRVGDRVHLSLGKAGDHWNLLGIGRPRARP